MKHGLYKVNFRTPRGNAAGVLFVMDGKFRGGDSGFYYIGTYNEAGSKINASVVVKRHTDGIPALLGDYVTVSLEGMAQEDRASLKATVAGKLGASFNVDVEWLAN
jgi:hypothetical protein